MPLSMYRKVGLASLIMMGSVFLSRVIGFGREMVIAYVAGAGGAVDAYQVAFVIPEILNHAVASGFLSVTFIPIFSRYLVAGKEAQGWEILSTILNLFGGGLVVLIFITWVLAPQLVDLLAPGLQDPLVKISAIRMTRIIIPAQFFFFAGGLFMAVQFAKERFLVPALAPLIYNIGIIAGGLFLGPRLGMEGFSWGVFGGAFLGSFLVQFIGARRAGMRLSMALDFRHPQLRKYVLLTLPLMLGLTMTFSTEIFFKLFGSYLPPGSIAGLNYALRIMFMVVGFCGQAVGVASFPFLARLAAENDLDEMNRLLNRTVQAMALVIPVSVLVIVLRHEVVQLLFQRGHFDTAATAVTAGALGFMMIGAVAFAAQTVVVRGFYALQNTLFPALFSTAAVLASIPIYLAGLRLMGLAGVALSVSLAAVVQTIVLFVVWNRRSRNRRAAAVYRFYFKIVALSIPLGLVLEGLKRLLYTSISSGSTGAGVIICLTIGAGFIALMVVGGRLFKITEITALTHLVSSKLKKMATPGRPRG